jgi:parvulin-like peptidyl-prolyl isomerase
VVADVTTHQPSDEELRKYFDEHRANFSTEGVMTLHNLLLPKAKGADALATAKKAADALRAHQPLDAVLKEYGLTELVAAHASEEQFYFAQKIHLGDALFEVATKLGDGDVSDPVEAPDGIHIVAMAKNVKPLPLTFERVRSQVLTEYITGAKKKLEDADLRYLRDKADIVIATDYADAYEKEQSEQEAAAKTAEAGKP